MTIDEADTILSCERLDSSMGCGASDEDIDNALGVAIATMRKYQKIQEIINYTGYIQEDVIRYKMICEVVKNGDDDR